ncbi:MAG: sigma-54 dependent transcriptional regulator [Acidobacteriia bacterium]|nr:sigma-54 dependent transcriptional regulator [Terriglobia bacterium]
MSSYPIPPNHADRILVASPSHLVRQRVLESLRSPLRHFEQTSGGAEALVQLERGDWQVLFLDRRLPDLDAEELSQTVRRRFPGIEVVLLDRELDPKSDVEGTVTEEKEDLPPEMQPVADASNNHVGADVPIRPAERSSTKNFAEDEVLPVVPLPGMIGNSRVMRPVYHLARLLAPRTTTVLITGPTGSGKEIVARAIHQLSPRGARPFAVVNCAAIPETLLEAELFGHTRGAFTGAMQSYAGRIQAAQGGTLFLDEIGEMPLSLQPKLLRFLERRELQRLGSAEVVRVDARVISATNAHLLSLVREGKFREDLYYRLCAFPIEIPPLRDRSEDIAQLAAHFLEEFSSHPPTPQMSPQVLQVLKTHAWPGNIRELQNVIERALILSHDEAVIRPEHLLLAEANFPGSR